MKYVFLIIGPLLLYLPLKAQNNALVPVNLLCEHRLNPLGITTLSPHLSWQMQTAERGQFQTAYRILVSSDSMKLLKDQADLWDSGKKLSDTSIRVPYEGKALKAGQKYFWKVMIWDKNGESSAWSKIHFWQMGLLFPADWGEARWIGMNQLDSSRRIVPGIHAPGHQEEYRNLVSGDHALPLLRKEFKVSKSVKQATVYISGLGHYEMYLNGAQVGDHFLAPGWTDYDDYCLYNTYDVTAQIKKGNNAMGVMLGNGFYNVPNVGYRKLLTAYANPQMILKLQITYTDGSQDVVVSDTSWQVHESPITFSSIYSGESYDARLEQKGWDQAGFNSSQWKNAIITEAPKGKLVSESDYPLKVEEALEVKSITWLSDSSYLYDFGQNASGIVELYVRGKRGQTVRMIPGELIYEDSTVNQSATGKPYIFEYTLKGDDTEIWRPRFSYYGFRYVQVEGAVPAESEASVSLPKIEKLTFLHTRNAAPRIGSFHCSDTLFNQIYDLINWAIKSNLQSVVTDCPHREKLGWLEQTHLMGGSIHYNFDIYGLYKKLVDDMIYAQTEKGLIPDIAPEFVVFEDGFRDSPEWGSAGIILPWMLYKWYGDKTVMEKAWPMMKKYVDYLESMSDHHIVFHGLGDWYDLGPEHPGVAQLTPEALTATAIYYYDVVLLSKMAGLLGDEDEQKKYLQMAKEVKAAFNARFFDQENKIYATGSQTALAMPLNVGLVPEAYQEAVFQHLKDSIIASNRALTAGDVGFHFLVETLSERGASQLLYEMNARTDVPGYGYQLKKGATALTESWQALEVVSNNHLMLGHVMQWFYDGLGGIHQTDSSVAYKEVIIRPEPVGKLTQVETSFESPYGTIVSHWKKDGGKFVLNTSIPANSTGVIYFPAKENDVIYESGQPIDQIEGIEMLGYKDGKHVFRIPSGNYQFEIKPPNE